ncbi:U11/U12 small nuclear ribonucleoprotein [Choanephora cucurbitarum]|uniref:U11/U12 small nuclear ribonucleoprotein n=1 Tax=Choanephora cucurbitarum TaxID=101091 RepID=A0A1C7NMJ8_9FUNG|nr:U11/U12 small nuclear ribonucleoprotein [Choanephora cucurbitarum]
MWYSKEYKPVQVGSIDGAGTVPHDAAVKRAAQSTYQPPKNLKTDPQCTLFVGRLSLDTSEASLHSHFEKYGQIKEVRIVRNQVTGISQGYGFVTFTKDKYTKDAYRHANKTTLDHHIILVDYERSRTMKGWIPRRLGGGFGGKKESGQLRFGGRDRPFRDPAQGHIPYDQRHSDDWRYLESKKRRSSSPNESKRYTKRSRYTHIN